MTVPSSANYNGLGKFPKVCINALVDVAPRKNKYARGNNIPFMNKSLIRAHMKKSRLRKKNLKKSLNLTDFLFPRSVHSFSISIKFINILKLYAKHIF